MQSDGQLMGCFFAASHLQRFKWFKWLRLTSCPVVTQNECVCISCILMFVCTLQRLCILWSATMHIHIKEHNSACGRLSSSLTSTYRILSMHSAFHRRVYFKVVLQIFVFRRRVDLPQATFTYSACFHVALWYVFTNAEVKAFRTFLRLQPELSCKKENRFPDR